MPTRLKNEIRETAAQWWLDIQKDYGVVSKTDLRKLLEILPSNDEDAATFIHDRVGDIYTYIPTANTKGDWYRWNGVVHEKEAKSLLDNDLTSGTAHMLKTAVQATESTINGSSSFDRATKDELINKQLAPLRAYARNLKNTPGINRLRERIRIEFREEPTYFDNDLDWAVLADGRVLDLNNLDGELLPPDPARPVARCLGVSYTEELEEPTRWLRALEQWLPIKAERDYLQICAGAALLGRGTAKNIVTLVGTTNTGKSTYINTMRKVFGTYAGALPATAIVQKYGGGTNFEQDKARGKRFLHLSEPQNTRTDDSFLKNLAGGGEPIPTAKKGQDTVDWYAQCVLHIGSNHNPKFDTRDKAIVDRMNLVGFDHVFDPEADPENFNPNLEAELIDEEGSQIFAWIVDGARDYQRLGKISVPDSIKQRAQNNVVEASASLRWLLERVEDQEYELQPGAPMNQMVTPKAAYDDFTQWAFANGEKLVNQKIWLKEIEAYNKMPASKKGKRSDGYARVYGVVPGNPALSIKGAKIGGKKCTF